MVVGGGREKSLGINKQFVVETNRKKEKGI
jgi:hypothetical protein